MVLECSGLMKARRVIVKRILLKSAIISEYFFTLATNEFRFRTISTGVDLY